MIIHPPSLAVVVMKIMFTFQIMREFAENLCTYNFEEHQVKQNLEPARGRKKEREKLALFQKDDADTLYIYIAERVD